MNKLLQKLGILSLITIFVFSAMICCCVTNQVQAEEVVHETMPDCHSTPATEDDQTTDDCDCPDSLTTSSKKQTIEIKFAKSHLVAIPHYIQTSLNEDDSYHISRASQFETYESLPLYLKHTSFLL